MRQKGPHTHRLVVRKAIQQLKRSHGRCYKEASEVLETFGARLLGVIVRVAFNVMKENDMPTLSQRTMTKLLSHSPKTNRDVRDAVIIFKSHAHEEKHWTNTHFQISRMNAIARDYIGDTRVTDSAKVMIRALWYAWMRKIMQRARRRAVMRNAKILCRDDVVHVLRSTRIFRSMAPSSVTERRQHNDGSSCTKTKPTSRNTRPAPTSAQPSRRAAKKHTRRSATSKTKTPKTHTTTMDRRKTGGKCIRQYVSKRKGRAAAARAKVVKKVRNPRPWKLHDSFTLERDPKGICTRGGQGELAIVVRKRDQQQCIAKRSHTGRRNLHKELTFARRAAKIGVGPEIVFEDNDVIIMEKLDKTLPEELGTRWGVDKRRRRKLKDKEIQELWNLIRATIVDGWKHGDIKANNIMIRDGRWYLIDFGFSSWLKKKLTNPQKELLVAMTLDHLSLGRIGAFRPLPEIEDWLEREHNYVTFARRRKRGIRVTKNDLKPYSEW